MWTNRSRLQKLRFLWAWPGTQCSVWYDVIKLYKHVQRSLKVLNPALKSDQASSLAVFSAQRYFPAVVTKISGLYFCPLVFLQIGSSVSIYNSITEFVFKCQWWGCKKQNAIQSNNTRFSFKNNHRVNSSLTCCTKYLLLVVALDWTDGSVLMSTICWLQMILIFMFAWDPRPWETLHTSSRLVKPLWHILFTDFTVAHFISLLFCIS